MLYNAVWQFDFKLPRTAVEFISASAEFVRACLVSLLRLLFVQIFCQSRQFLCEYLCIFDNKSNSIGGFAVGQAA